MYSGVTLGVARLRRLRGLTRNIKLHLIGRQAIAVVVVVVVRCPVVVDIAHIGRVVRGRLVVPRTGNTEFNLQN